MNKPFVLVVEDDNAVRNLIATTLETHDYKYHTSQTGKQAIIETASFRWGWNYKKSTYLDKYANNRY